MKNQPPSFGKLTFIPCRTHRYLDKHAIDAIDSVPWIGNNATCAADPGCAAHSPFSFIFFKREPATQEARILDMVAPINQEARILNLVAPINQEARILDLLAGLGSWPIIAKKLCFSFFSKN